MTVAAPATPCRLSSSGPAPSTWIHSGIAVIPSLRASTIPAYPAPTNRPRLRFSASGAMRKPRLRLSPQTVTWRQRPARVVGRSRLLYPPRGVGLGEFSDGHVPVARKLTTILCADVEGYTRLMGRDEVATLDLLKR